MAHHGIGKPISSEKRRRVKRKVGKRRKELKPDGSKKHRKWGGRTGGSSGEKGVKTALTWENKTIKLLPPKKNKRGSKQTKPIFAPKHGIGD